MRSIFAGGNAKNLLEAAVQVTLIAKACAVGDVCDCFTSRQKLSRPMHAHDGLILMRRDSNLLVKRTYQVVGTQAGDTGKRVYRHIFFRVGVEPILDSRDCRVFSYSIT